MNNKLLLVNAITLLYRESQQKNNQENSAILVREIIQNIQLPELSVGVDYERDIVNDLKQMALAMCEAPPGHQYEVVEILQRLKVVCRDEITLYEALEAGIVPEMAETTLKRSCMNIQRNLIEYLKEEKIKSIMNKAATALKFGRNKITNMKAFVAEVCAQLEPYQVDNITRDPAIISAADTASLESATAVFENVKNEATGSAVYRTGWQGLNRALDGGTRGGEEWVQAALQHNYKSGMNTSVFMDTALFNTPVLKDETKKAALLHISCEDPLYMKYQFMFKRLKGIEAMRAGTLDQMTEEVISNLIANTSAEDMATYVNNALNANGFTCFFIEINPGMATYRTLQNEVLRLEAEGYEVQMLSVDYLLKVPTTGCEGNAAGEALRNMYEKMSSFAKHRGMRFMTPHQISTDAKMMIREGRSGFVQALVGGGYYAGSKQLDQVVDLETFQHIEKVNGKSYLTIQRGKHRKDQIRMTPQEFLYFVLEFHPVFGLLPDVEGPDTTRKKVGGGPIGSGEEIPFWENDDQI
jgi:hypothetical protein